MRLITLFLLVACSANQNSEERAAEPSLSTPVAQSVERSASEGLAPSPQQEAVALSVIAVAEPSVVPEPPDEIDRSFERTVSVQYGETLGHLAIWAQTTIEDLSERSAISSTATLRPGDKVVVSLQPEEIAHFELARELYHKEKLERFIDAQGGLLGESVYQVKTRDTADRISRNTLKAPIWVLQAYNPATDLEAIRVGQRLLIPQFAGSSSTVAEGDLRNDTSRPTVVE